MFIGKVTGHIVTTQKEAAMSNAKLLVVEAYNAAGPADAALRPTGRVLVAIDSLGAGTGDFVLVTQGSSARLTELTKTMPVDAVVIGIVDTVRLHDRVLRGSDGTLDGGAAPGAERKRPEAALPDGKGQTASDGKGHPPTDGARHSSADTKAQRRGKP